MRKTTLLMPLLGLITAGTIMAAIRVTAAENNVCYYSGGRTEWKHRIIEAQKGKKIVDADDNLPMSWRSGSVKTPRMMRGMVLDSFWANNALADSGAALTAAGSDKNKPVIFYRGKWTCKRSQAGCIVALESTACKAVS